MEHLKEDAMKRCLGIVFGVGMLAATPLVGQEAQDTKTSAEGDQVKREEIVVVSASKVESTLINAPATMSGVGTRDTRHLGRRRTSATSFAMSRA